MWTPWRTSMLAGLAAGVAILGVQRNSDPIFALGSAVILALGLSALNLAGLWLSRRPMLSPGMAVLLIVLVACDGVFAGWPIKTHAVAMDMPSAPPVLDSAFWPGLLPVAFLALPTVFAFLAGVAFGMPPNNSLERSRDR